MFKDKTYRGCTFRIIVRFVFIAILFSSLAGAQTGEWTIYTPYNSSLPGAPNSIAIDNDGNTWTGTWGGLIKFNGTNWSAYHVSDFGCTDLCDFVSSIVIDKDNYIWSAVEYHLPDDYGHYSKALVEFNGTNWTVFGYNSSLLNSALISSIAIDASGNKWIGTNGAGLVKFDGTNWFVYNTTSSGLPTNYLTSGLAIDDTGNIWIGAQYGVVKFDGATWTTYNPPGNLGIYPGSVNSIAIDKNGDKWFGTSAGLAKFDGTNWAVYDSTNVLPGDWITSIAIDTNNNKWIGVIPSNNIWHGNTGGGLVKFDDINWVVYDQSNSGLPDDSVQVVTSDQNNSIWIGTDGTNASLAIYKPTPSSTPIPVLKTITVSPLTATLNVSETQVFTATAFDQNQAPMAGINISWTVSNSTVGNIDTLYAITDINGNVSTAFTALASGTTNVTATNGTVSGWQTVTVTEPTSTSTPLFDPKISIPSYAPSQQQAHPKTELTYFIRVLNNGNQVDTIDLTLTPTPLWDTKLSANSVTLDPGAYEDIRLTVTTGEIPSGKFSATDTFKVKGTSRGDSTKYSTSSFIQTYAMQNLFVVNLGFPIGTKSSLSFSVPHYVNIDNKDSQYLQIDFSQFSQLTDLDNAYVDVIDTSGTATMFPIKFGINPTEVDSTGFDRTKNGYSFSNGDLEGSGACYGISATSILYFNGKLPLPNQAINTYALEINDALTNINTYQKDPFWNGIPNNLNWIWGDNKEDDYSKLKEYINKGIPLIYFLGGGSGLDKAHAVVAYKIVEDANNHISYIMIYDNNWAWGRPWDVQHPDYITYNWDTKELLFLTYTKFSWHEAKPYYQQIIKHSPGELRVYDSSGRITGMIDGQTKNEIPYAMYDQENDTVTIFSPDDTYMYDVAGTTEGTYGLDIISVKDGERTVFSAKGIPLILGQMHQYTIDWNLLYIGGKGVTLQMDYEGDGTFDRTIQTGPTLTDITPPTTNLTFSGTLGNNNWYTSDVQVNLTATDNVGGSGINTTKYSFDNSTWNTYITSFNITNEGITTLYYYSIDNANNIEPTKNQTIKIDKTPSEITINTPASEYLLKQTIFANWSANDPVSGISSTTGTTPSGEAIDTATVGTKTFNVVVMDNAGNSATRTVSYNVVYNFDGFFQPIDSTPTLNTIKAGSAVPVKFSLNGDQGLSIFQTGYPKSSVTSCDSTAPVDAVEEIVTAGSSNLSYNATTDQYNYVWKTDKAWAGTCRQLVVQLKDGTSHRANFKLLK